MLRSAWLLAACAAIGLASGVGSAGAQTAVPTTPGVTSTVPPTKAKAQTKTKGPDPATEARTPDQQLRARVDLLEEQYVDMQVAMGTLESLARGGGSGSAPSSYRPPAPGGAGAIDTSRVDGLETQVRALAADVQRLSDEVRSLRAQLGQPGSAPLPGARVGMVAPVTSPSGFGQTTVQPGGGAATAAARDPIGQVLSAEPAAPAGPDTDQIIAGTAGFTAKQLYDQGYGYLLQPDPAAAQAVFEELLKRYPNDELAGNSAFWLGETFFMRQQYKQAATAYLNGYQKYPRSLKAPDSLLKLALSFDRLGQKEAACSTLGQLSSQYPSAPPPLKARADDERRRVGC